MTAPPQPSPPATTCRAVFLAVALLELVLAGLARATARGGWCPVEGGPLGCASVVRPRVSQLGPISMGDLGILGASLALGVAMVFFLRGPRRPLARDGSIALAACAGFALGIQPLAFLAGGALCPTCLALAGAAVGSAALAATLAKREAGVDPRLAAGVGILVWALVTGGSAWRGASLRTEDEARTAAALSAGAEVGPRVVLVSVEGCPYCQATLADVLGDPDMVELLNRTRGLEVVRPDDPRAEGLEGVPVLLGFASDGARVGEPLVGYPSLQEGYDWLQALIDGAPRE